MLGEFSFWCRKGRKRFAKANLHCIVRNQKKDKRNVEVASPWKVSAHDCEPDLIKVADTMEHALNRKYEDGDWLAGTIHNTPCNESEPDEGFFEEEASVTKLTITTF